MAFWRSETECLHTYESAIKLYGVGTYIVLTESTGIMCGLELLDDPNWSYVRRRTPDFQMWRMWYIWYLTANHLKSWKSWKSMQNHEKSCLDMFWYSKNSFSKSFKLFEIFWKFSVSMYFYMYFRMFPAIPQIQSSAKSKERKVDPAREHFLQNPKSWKIMHSRDVSIDSPVSERLWERLLTL